MLVLRPSSGVLYLALKPLTIHTYQLSFTLPLRGTLRQSHSAVGPRGVWDPSEAEWAPRSDTRRIQTPKEWKVDEGVERTFEGS